MKLIKLMLIVISLVGVSACDTLGDKKSSVDVEDRGVEGGSASEEGLNDGAETKVIAGEELYQGDDLNDPASLLSNRVIYFEYDSSAVREEDLATLESHSAYLSEHSNSTVRLVGHTDKRGSREYNLALGERRALSVRQILMLQGASVEQFQTTSYGEERPEVEGNDENAWQQNRRVELVYLGQ